MSTTVTAAEAPSTSPDPAPARWNPLTRIAFRFCFLYFGLFCLTYPQVLFAFLGWFGSWLPADAVQWQVHLLEPALSWVGRTVFDTPVTLKLTGSGDGAIFWVLLFCLLVVAVAGTLVWTVCSRRAEHRRLAGWFLLVLRLCVAGQMVNYGLAKVLPSQMPQPSLATLLEPFGNQPMFEVLWNQIGVAPVYEIALGAAELLAGILLFVPRTAIPGALLTLVGMAQVFLLNMTFDVPVKILSGHLLLMSLVLLAPQAQRLAAVLVLDRAIGRSSAPEPWRTVRSRRIAALVQVALGIWVVVATVHVTWGIFQQVGPDRPKPALYGIWSVSEFTRDGKPVPPLLTDQTRWRTVVFDYVGLVSYQKMDGTTVTVPGTIDPGAHRIELAGGSRGSLTFEQPAADRLTLTGELDGRPVTVALQQVDVDSLPLHRSGFQWVQEHPGH